MTDSPSPDSNRFLGALAQHADLIAPGRETWVARAPGRLDVMGGIADYSGSLVLQLPLACAAHVAAQFAPEPVVAIRSLNADDLGADRDVVVPLEALAEATYDQARALFQANPKTHWAAYVAGVLVVLARERGIGLDRGLRLLLGSDVPAGKGVSSSAAVEVAAMSAAGALLGHTFGSGRELAILCQTAENRVVGAPCGVMDQMTSACGERGALLALVCQPAELLPSARLPDALEVWGIDSGIRHAVSGSDYTGVRVGAFMGYRILADLAGLPCRVEGGQARVDDTRWGGYLANLAPSEWETRYRDGVPLEMRGDAFLARYGGTTDAVTRVDPGRVYAVRVPAAHPIHEHHRVRLFHALLEHGRGEDDWRLLGELMYQSHAAYGACGLGSDGTDALVEMARGRGPAEGVYGAKITGGGSGGTIAVLTRRGAGEVVARIAADYAAATGRASSVIGGSSPGATVWRHEGY